MWRTAVILATSIAGLLGPFPGPAASADNAAASVPLKDILSGERFSPRETYERRKTQFSSFSDRDRPNSAWFLVRSAGATDWTRVYRADWDSADGPTFVDLRLLDLKDVAVSDSAACRLFRQTVTVEHHEYQAARELVERADSAAADWDACREHLTEALAADAQRSRSGWLRIATSLEAVHEIEPTHLGVLLDLITAYVNLQAHEQQTGRGRNLDRLIPQRIDEFQSRAQPLLPDELRALTRARALYYFQSGLYPLAQADLNSAGGDAGLDAVQKALRALGQNEFTTAGTLEVRGELATYDVTVYKATGTPPTGKLLFDQTYFVAQARPPSGQVCRIWYSLASQTLSDKPRYYLYGHAGSSRNLLRLYGDQPPGVEEVGAYVQSLMQAALARPKVVTTHDQFNLVMVGLGAALFLCLIVAGVIRLCSPRRVGGAS